VDIGSKINYAARMKKRTRRLVSAERTKGALGRSALFIPCSVGAVLPFVFVEIGIIPLAWLDLIRSNWMLHGIGC